VGLGLVLSAGTGLPIAGPTLTANFSIALAGGSVTGSMTQGSPSTGTYHDEGTSTLDVDINTLGATLNESFTSSPAQPVPSGPTASAPSAPTVAAR
jgi:hypothetical protein